MTQPKKIKLEYENLLSNEITSFLDYIKKDFFSENNFIELTPEIFVLASLMYESCILHKVILNLLDNKETNINILYDKMFSRLMKENKFVTIVKPGREIKQSLDFRYFLSSSVKYRSMTESKYINSDHVFYAMFNDEESQYKEYSNNIINDVKECFNISITKQQIKTSMLEIHDVLINLKNIDNFDNEKNYISMDDDPLVQSLKIFNDENKHLLKTDVDFENNENGEYRKKKQSSSNDLPYCLDITKKLNILNVDKLIGRENEINQIIKVLFRKKCNKVIIVGESGVGKTQIVYGLAQKIINLTCPIEFRNKKIYKLSISQLVSNTTLRGMLEERISKLIVALKKNRNSILFIDDIHTLINGYKDSDNTFSIFLELFNDDSIQIIGCTNQKGYKSIFDNNKELSRRFQKIQIDKPTIDETFDILKGVKKSYETFHNVKFSDDILKKCIELSDRYVTEKTLPCSAIDILDETGAFTHLKYGYDNTFKELLENLNNLNDKESNDKINDSNSVEELTSWCMGINNVKNQLAKKETEINEMKPIDVTLDDLFKTISEHTSIPMENINTFNIQSLKKISDKLKQHIIGQDEAINAVTKAIQKNKLGLSNTNKPILSALLIGTSGCGKTLLAKKLAKEIFGSDKYLIRFDMSEYSDKTSVNKLIGSSAGYVGYSEGGLITEAVKNQKYAVLLIDEIEKADDSVFNLFLQILDEGFLTDNMGVKVDFKNTIILMTSNVGTKKANTQNSIGFSVDEAFDKKKIIEKEMKNIFPPEFLNRFDDIIIFNKLSVDNMKSIISLELDNFNKKLLMNNYDILYKNKEDVINYIYDLICDEIQYGARPILRAIKCYIEDKITDLIIDNCYTNYTFNIEVVDNKIKIK